MARVQMNAGTLRGSDTTTFVNIFHKVIMLFWHYTRIYVMKWEECYGNSVDCSCDRRGSVVAARGVWRQ